MLAVERALDVIGDYLSTTEDADQRAAMVERLEALVHQYVEKPSSKSARKRKVVAKNIGPPGFPIQVTMETDNE